MPAGRVFINASTPDAYGETLPHGEIWYDPVHGELIGDETPEEYAEKLRAMSILGDAIDPEMWTSPERYHNWKELVGQEEESEESESEDVTEETEEEGEEAPSEEGPPEGEPYPEEGPGGDSFAPGGFGAPAPPPGVPTPSPGVSPGFPGVAAAVSAFRRTMPLRPVASRPPVPVYKRVPKKPTAKIAVARFRANIKARNPQALKALALLKRKGRTSAKHRAAFNLIIRGDIIAGANPIATRTVANLLTAVLSPVAWGIHGVGTVSHEVAKTLNHLASKL